jgi:hypothetical protein
VDRRRDAVNATWEAGRPAPGGAAHARCLERALARFAAQTPLPDRVSMAALEATLPDGGRDGGAPDGQAPAPRRYP